MDTKPPTRTLPKLVMKEWPKGYTRIYTSQELSDFTRVVEETGILDQERSQKADTPPRRSSLTE